MSEITIDVESGEIIPLSIPLTSSDITLTTGVAWLCGWSIREASGDSATAVEANLVSPGAGAVIATSAALAVGVYDVAWTVELIGAAAAADANNFALFVGGVQITASVNAGAAGVYVQPNVRVNAGAGATVQIKAIGAGTVGVTYSVSVSIVPANQVDAAIEIRDGRNPVAEIGVPVAGVSSQSFGVHGLKIRSDITLHIVSGVVTGAVYARLG